MATRQLPLVLLIMAASTTLRAEEAGEHVITLAENAFQMQVSPDWKRVEPRVRIIDHEFAVTSAEGDELPGRVTVMGAGGTVEANIDRWLGQFTQPDGGSSRERARQEKKAIAGQEVHLLDVSGTYDDKRGPFAPGVKRPGFRMLAAIVMTKKQGNYFVKFYGPEKTVAENEKAFAEMIESLEGK